MPPLGMGVRPGFVLASEAVACRLFQLHNVLYGYKEASGTLCTLYGPQPL